MENEEQEYKIEDIEAKVKQLKNSVLKIGYEILSMMDNGQAVPKKLIAEQKAKEKQYVIFNKMFKQTKQLVVGNNPISQILSEISKVKLEMADIHQNLIKQDK